MIHNNQEITWLIVEGGNGKIYNVVWEDTVYILAVLIASFISWMLMYNILNKELKTSSHQII